MIQTLDYGYITQKKIKKNHLYNPDVKKLRKDLKLLKKVMIQRKK